MFQPGDFVQTIGTKAPKILLVTEASEGGFTRCKERGADGVYGSPRKVADDKLALLPPYRVSAEELREAARFETDVSTLAGMNLPENCTCPEPYPMTPEDLREALLNHIAAGSTALRLVKDWFVPVSSLLGNALEISRYFPPEEQPPLPADGESAFRFVWNALGETAEGEYNGEASAESVFSLREYEELIRRAVEEADLPLREKTFSPRVREAALRWWNTPERLSRATEEELALVRDFTETLCRENHPLGFSVKGYASYGGNALYPENWETARDCMLRLLELEPSDAFPANTLGYIYYYGRCNGGVPQYEEAFRYFSVGAFAGVFESKYKVADMLLNGRGVPKNYEAARRLYVEVYNENLEHIVHGHFDCKFADAALRMSRLYRDGIGTEKDPDTAYRMLLQAEYAILRRMECADYYGDNTVLASIRKEKQELLPSLPYRTDATVSCADNPWMLRPLPGETCRLSLKEMDDGTLRLTAKKNAVKGEEPAMTFVLLPECGFCELTSTFVMYADRVTDYTFPEGKREAVYDRILAGDGGRRWSFCLGDTEVARVRTRSFLVRVPGPDRTDKPLSFAAVRFSPEGREYDFLRGSLRLKAGDTVIVPSASGEEEAVVTRVYETTEPLLPVGRYKQVLRKVKK